MNGLVGQDNVNIENCPTDKMIADFMTKPLVRGKFKIFQDLVMNISNEHHRIGHQYFVGWNIKGLKII